jgi:hypothetical protein
MKILSPWLCAAALVAGSAAGLAQIQRLTLDQMVQATDDAVVGTIVEHKVFRVDHPVDGPELYFTTLTIQGNSLGDGRERQVEVTFPGGFINEHEGVWNSEAPAAAEIRIGNRVVAFFGWTDNMGGGVAGNSLWASHGGLYQVAGSSAKPVVLGKGEGYAVSSNWQLEQLDTEITRLTKLLKKN